MHELMKPILALIIGCVVGYGYGLSLLKQARALSAFSFIPFLRIAVIAILAFHLLHWGTIAFILFVGSLWVTQWAKLLITTNTP